jgi:NADPH:quinone reductase-like Zn-dependent oxidoreductase
VTDGQFDLCIDVLSDRTLDVLLPHLTAAAVDGKPGCELITSGRLRPQIDRVVPLAQTRAAYEALEKEHRRGKVVIQVAEG